jgi:hypothetical protein
VISSSASFHNDPDEVMPPPKSHKPKLKADQVALLKRWISEGAAWGKHWSLEKPVKAKDRGPSRGFLREGTSRERKDLKMSPKAPEHTLEAEAGF